MAPAETSPQSIADLVWEFFVNCVSLLQKVLLHPPRFAIEDAPSSKQTGLFVTAAAFIVAVFLRVLQSSTPAIISWNDGNSTVLVNTLREWSDLQAGDQALTIIGVWAAWTAILLMFTALAMTISLSLMTWRVFGSVESGTTLKQSCIVVSSAVTVMVLSEAFVPVAARASVPGWVVAIVYCIFVWGIPAYVVLVVPYRVWRPAFNLSRWRAALVVLLSWIMALVLAELIPFDYFVKENRIDSVLSAELQSVIRLSQQGKYRQAIDQASRSASSNSDSVQLDSLTLSVLSRAFDRAVLRSTTFGPLPADDDKDWSLDIKGRYSDLEEVTDRLQRKYSDVPGMLLKVARAQLGSGQCDRAELVFEAVYRHRHAILMERLFAGSYLRAMGQIPDDFGPLLARFGPSDDLTFMRALIASPGIALGMFPNDLTTTGRLFQDLQKYAEELLRRSSPPRCNFVGNTASSQAATTR